MLRKEPIMTEQQGPTRKQTRATRVATASDETPGTIATTVLTDEPATPKRGAGKKSRQADQDTVTSTTQNAGDAPGTDTSPAASDTRKPAAADGDPGIVGDTDTSGTSDSVDAPDAVDSEERPNADGGSRRQVPVPFTGLRVPVPNISLPTVHLPHVPLPSQQTIVGGAAKVGDAVRDNAPTGDQLVYYGGLGALAAFGVVDWPVAAAIAVGVWVARRRSQTSREPESADTATAEPERTMTAEGDRSTSAEPGAPTTAEPEPSTTAGSTAPTAREHAEPAVATP
jgi:hypothetical protein